MLLLLAGWPPAACAGSSAAAPHKTLVNPCRSCEQPLSHLCQFLAPAPAPAPSLPLPPVPTPTADCGGCSAGQALCQQPAGDGRPWHPLLCRGPPHLLSQWLPLRLGECRGGGGGGGATNCNHSSSGACAKACMRMQRRSCCRSRADACCLHAKALSRLLPRRRLSRPHTQPTHIHTPTPPAHPLVCHTAAVRD